MMTGQLHGSVGRMSNLMGLAWAWNLLTVVMNKFITTIPISILFSFDVITAVLYKGTQAQQVRGDQSP
jgi:hypothetical protein